MVTTNYGSSADVIYYDASTPNRASRAALAGKLVADICVIGGGIAGCSAALHLAERGYRVTLLEATCIGAGASGRSGGQIIPGFSADQDKLVAMIGAADALRMWKLSVEAIDLLRELIARYAIACEWTPGHLQVAIKARQLHALAEWQATLHNRYHYPSVRLLNRDETQAVVTTQRYCGGLHDSNAGHLHPLKYVLGIAEAAIRAGVKIFEASAAVEIIPGNPVSVKTAHGTICAAYIVVCGGAYLGNLVPEIQSRIMPVATHVIATEPLGQMRAADLIRDNSAVADTNFILDYFRRSADHRLLFGGRVSYAGSDMRDTTDATRRCMLKVFPQLRDAKIDYAWSGLLDITMNRAPDFGRIAANVYYLQGFSGHGVALATIAGKSVAEAIAGEAERFDIFGRIPHRKFPGGALLRTPALVLAMLWYRLRDLL